MALPFIVGPHQCSLTQGPDGRPQVEVVLRIRLPLAEFFDALLLSLADQHPLFQQVGHEPAPTPIAPVKAGLQATEHRSPPLKEEASPKRKTTGRTQPKRPAHPPKHVTPVDPTHEKLLAVLSHAARLPDTDEGGAAMAAADFPPASPGNRQTAGLPDRQLAVDSLHSSASHTGIFNIVLRRTERMSIYHRRVLLHTQRSALSSEPVERPNAPLPMLTRAPYQMSLFVSADLWLRARETACQPAFFCIIPAGFRLHTLL